VRDPDDPRTALAQEAAALIPPWWAKGDDRPDKSEYADLEEK